MKRFSIAFVLVLAGMSALAPSAHAYVYSTYTITNNSGAQATDLHLVFNGTGGTASMAFPFDLGNQTINGHFESGQGSPWDVVFDPNHPVAPGHAVQPVIASDNAPTFVSGYWTPSNAPLAPGDVVLTAQKMPGLGRVGAGALAAMMVAAGWFGLRRRARGPARV